MCAKPLGLNCPAAPFAASKTPADAFGPLIRYGLLSQVTSLLRHSDATVQRQAMQLFNQKLAAVRQSCTESERTLFVQLARDLLEIIDTKPKSPKAAKKSPKKPTAPLANGINRQYG